MRDGFLIKISGGEGFGKGTVAEIMFEEVLVEDIFRTKVSEIIIEIRT